MYEVQSNPFICVRSRVTLSIHFCRTKTRANQSSDLLDDIVSNVLEMLILNEFFFDLTDALEGPELLAFQQQSPLL